MALYGAGWAIAIDVGVRVYVAEVVALLGLVYLRWWVTIQRYPQSLSVLGAYALWALAIVLSDLVNGTALFDSLRNLATPIIGAIGLIFVICSLSKAPNALVAFLVSMGVMKAILGEPSYGDSFSNLTFGLESIILNTNFFKVRFEPFITPLALIIGIFLFGRGMRRASVIWLFLVAATYFSVDARSSGLSFLLSSVLLYFFGFGRIPRTRNLIAGAFLSLFIFYGFYFLYINYTFNTALGGHNYSQLLQLQNPYNPFSLLFAGRSDWLVIPQAVAERPFFGWGSWAIDEGNHFNFLRIDALGVESYASLVSDPTEKYIPVHSVVGSTWVWSGAIGILSMLWLAKSIVMMLSVIPAIRSHLLPAVCYFGVMLIWHFMFSPPQSVRLFFPYALGALIVMSAQALKQQPQFLPKDTVTMSNRADI